MQPTLDDLADDPHPHLRALREQAPVAWVDVLGGWLVTSRAHALAVMRDPGTFTVDDPRFSTARVVGPSMLSTDGPVHDRHRRPFAPAFRLHPVQDRLGPAVAAETDRLLDELVAGGRVAADLRRTVTGPLATAVMRDVLGLEQDVAQVLRWYEAIVAAVEHASPQQPVDPAGTRAFAELAAAIGSELADDGLSREEAVANAAVLLFGGIDTTDGMLANALWHLLSHPETLAAVRADPGLLAAVVEESLRLEPAAARVDRYATADAQLAGARIRRGDLVVVSVTAANRDPAAFERPDAFVAGRPDARRHLAFAAGPHVCLGMHLARLEAHTALQRLLERLPGLRLDPERPSRPQGLVFRKPPSLWVRWDPAASAG